MKKVRNRFAIVVALFLTVFFGSLRQPIYAGLPTENNSAHESGETGHETPNANPMEWKSDLALWSLVIFGGLVIILGTFGFKPIAKALDDREKQVADNINGAERANQEAKELLKQYQTKLAEAEGEVKAIVEAGKQEAIRTGEAMIAKSREAAESERTRATKEIEAATTGALQELATKSADLAVTLAGRILHEKLDPKSHAELIKSAVSNFSKN